MRDNIDQIDHDILEALTRNGRISHADLGEQVRLSRNAVRQRIERLERTEHIQGYTIVRGSLASESQTVSAVLLVYRQDRMRGVDVLAALRLIPEVTGCDVLSGDFDLLVRVEALSVDRVRKVWGEISALHGVRDIVTALTLATAIRRSLPDSENS